MTDFFISYTQVDRSWAEWIAWQLEAAGYTTVNQAWDFRPGANFALAMQDAVAKSARTIAVLSPAYLQSGFTAAEWAAAFARDPTGTHGRLLPVRIHDCEPQGVLPQIVHIDLVGLDAEAARETLLAGVRRQRPKPTRAPGFPGPSLRSVTTPPLYPGVIPPAFTTYQRQITSGDEQLRRNRRQMLEKVRHTWITGLLEPSLAQLARLELGLETKPDAVDRPFDLFVQRPQQAPHPLPPGTPISQIFDDAGNALLILGQPGAGKTTLLLELTRDLLERARQDERHLIPVVFNLSSWAEQRLALADWLVDELIKRYDVPHTLAQAWVADELILPLLDGLDEVAAEHRDTCVKTINDFVHAHGLLPLVVCSRIAHYEALAVRLCVPSAVLIQALRWPQVQQYVEQAGAALAGLRTVLHNDTTLRELLDTPLMLSIVALAYHGHAAEEIHAVGTVEEHRTQLFAAYTEAMFHRRATRTPYTREQTEHWLTWLAKAMKNHSQTIFYLEWMQPDWVPVQRQQRLVTFITLVLGGLSCGLIGGLIGCLIGGLIGGVDFGLGFGLISGLGVGLISGLSVGIRRPLVSGLIGELIGGLFGVLKVELGFGLISGLIGGLMGVLSGMLVGHSKEIKPIETIRWSWSAARYKWLSNLFKWLSFGLSVGLLSRLSVGLSVGLSFGLSFGLNCGLIGCLIGGLLHGFTVGDIRTQSFPNEGIRRSVRNALISGLSFVLSIGLIGGLGFGLGVGLLSRLSVGLSDTLIGGLRFGLIGGLRFGLFGWLNVGLSVGLSVGLRFGGRACLHHFALRLVLWYKNFAPLHYVRFLDYAVARIFLHKVGGGYVFVHRMLLEYFVARYQASAEQQKLQH